MRVLVLLLLAAGLSHAETSRCTVDADCTMSTFVGCCERCPSPPRAWSKRALAERRQRCAIVDCDVDTTMQCGPTPKEPTRTAHCVDKQCVAR